MLNNPKVVFFADLRYNDGVYHAALAAVCNKERSYEI